MLINYLLTKVLCTTNLEQAERKKGPQNGPTGWRAEATVLRSSAGCVWPAADHFFCVIAKHDHALRLRELLQEKESITQYHQ